MSAGRPSAHGRYQLQNDSIRLGSVVERSLLCVDRYAGLIAPAAAAPAAAAATTAASIHSLHLTASFALVIAHHSCLSATKTKIIELCCL